MPVAIRVTVVGGIVTIAIGQCGGAILVCGGGLLLGREEVVHGGLGNRQGIANLLADGVRNVVLAGLVHGAWSFHKNWVVLFKLKGEKDFFSGWVRGKKRTPRKAYFVELLVSKGCKLGFNVVLERAIGCFHRGFNGVCTKLGE